MTKSERAIQNRTRELEHVVKIARAHAAEQARAGGNFDVAESIAILIDHIGELERMLDLIKSARESQARTWPAFAVHGVKR